MDSSVYLPAGEVYVTPVPGTAEGKVVLAKDFYQGKEINNLTMTFAAGRLTSMTGSGAGFDLMKAAYDAAGEGKELFAVVDFGINPNVKLPQGSQVATWVPAGTVTLDDKTVVEAGQLKLQPRKVRPVELLLLSVTEKELTTETQRHS